MASDSVRMRRAAASLKEAGTRVARLQTAVNDHLSGPHGDRVEGALALQRLIVVRAERDLEEILAGLRRAAG